MSIADQFGLSSKTRRKNDPPLTLPAPRPLDELDVVRPPPSRRSDAAAIAAQHVEDLENLVETLRVALAEEKGVSETLRTANNILNTDCETLKLRGEVNAKKLTAYHAKLEVAGKIILDLWREEAAEPTPTPEVDMAALNAAVEEPK